MAPPQPIEIIERPFFERYPSQFLEKDGALVFSENIYTSELHEKYLPEEYFPLVMQIPRFPRYKNKRGIDPYVKGFLDENHIRESPNWGLPVPNAEAAYKSLSKYAKNIPSMSEQQVKNMNLAWEWTIQHFQPYMGNAEILTVEEAIAGLDLQTSSGAPFSLFFPKKKELFENWKEAPQWLEKDWELLANDPNYTFLFTNSLKEEVRPQDKIAMNKIRTFLAGAVDGTVHGSRLFADMNQKMNSSHLQSSSGVGMSPYEGTWDQLYRKLNVFSKGYALDESEYDSSLKAYLMWACARLRYQMLAQKHQTPENLRRIKTYYRNLVNSLIVTAEGVLIFKLTGNPSGSVNTINDNTLILYALLAYGWIENCPGQPFYSEFEDNTSKVLVGDDNTWTVSDWAHDFFNAETVIKTWGKIGITTTTDSMKPRSAKELDFLSAHTIFFKGKAVPVYDRAKLMTSLLYSPTHEHSPAVTLTRAAAMLTVGWTDHQFRHFCRDFIEWLMNKFDKICSLDRDWIIAKTGILSDQRLARLFIGETTTILQQQGFNLETQERYIKLNKSRMSRVQRPNKSQGRGSQGVKVIPQNKNTNKAARIPKLAAMKNERKKVALRKMPPKMAPRRKIMSPQQVRKFSGFGDYTEEKGRQLYEKKKMKKRRKKEEASGWWDTISDLASKVGPLVGPIAMKAIASGFGDYTVDTNSITAAASGGKIGGDVPLVENTHMANFVHHREYLGPVFGNSTNDFDIQKQIELNAGLAETMPWGHKGARGYTRCRWRGMLICYEPTASVYAATSNLGYVAISTAYNPRDADFTNKVDALNYEYSSKGRPCDTILHPIECARSQMGVSEFFIRDGPLATGDDLAFYDIGKTSIICGSNPTDEQIGDLYITYEVEYLTPKLNSHTVTNLQDFWYGLTDETTMSLLKPCGTFSVEAGVGECTSTFPLKVEIQPGGYYRIIFPDWFVPDTVVRVIYIVQEGTPVTIATNGQFVRIVNETMEIAWINQNGENSVAGNVGNVWTWDVEYYINSTPAMFDIYWDVGSVIPMAGAGTRVDFSIETITYGPDYDPVSTPADAKHKRESEHEIIDNEITDLQLENKKLNDKIDLLMSFMAQMALNNNGATTILK